MIHTSCELMRIKHLLEELRFDMKMPMSMYCHNQVAVHIASNFVFHERTKHIEIDFHIVWERVKSGVISYLIYFYRFTKALCKTRLDLLCKKLGLMIYISQLEGDCYV